jgi:hypothetical protein
MHHYFPSKMAFMKPLNNPQAVRRALQCTIKDIWQRNADAAPDEIQRIVDEAVSEVRSQHRAKEKDGKTRPPPWTELDEDAARQYIDARACYSAWEDARRQAASPDVTGSMHWRKRQTDREYLIRTTADGSQKSLGRRTPETEQIFKEFTERKEMAEIRLKGLTAALVRHQRMNKSLYIGQAPRQLIDALSSLPANAVVTSDHALYAYAAAAGVRLRTDLLPSDTDPVGLKWEIVDPGPITVGNITIGIRSLDEGLDNFVSAAEALARGDKVKKQRGIYFENLDAFRKIHLEPLGSRKDYDAGNGRVTAVVVAKTGHMARMNAILPGKFVERKRGTGPLSGLSEIIEVIEGLVMEYLQYAMR